MTLPARKEGIIPAMANLRLPRFVGDRIARQAIMYERRIECDSPGGPPDLRRDRAGRRHGRGHRPRHRRLTSSGAVSAIGNRRALRFADEPLDTFRRYARSMPASRPTAISARR